MRTLTDVEVPIVYIVKRGLDQAKIPEVQAALSLTPCQAVFINDLADHDLANVFSSQIMCATSEESALLLACEWAQRIGRPMMVIGQSDLLDAVYADGKREGVVVA